MNSCKEKINSFASLLQDDKVGELSLQPFPQKYLLYLLDNIDYYLQTYAHLLDLVIVNSSKPIANITLLDQGCGNGLLGLFAKHCGFGKVLMNDLDKDFIEAAQQISNQTGLLCEDFITGDIDAVIENALIKPDVIVSTDVFEHIYDPLKFLKLVKEWNNDVMLFFKTPSNPANPILNNRLRKMQQKDEWEGGTANDYATFGEQHLPYRSIRKNIIEETGIKLSEDEFNRLIELTRGLRKDDIITVINVYSQHKVFPVKPLHPTNTCHPLTGSWTERLLTAGQYEKIFSEAGFILKIENGFYNQWKHNQIHSFIMRMANAVLSIMGKYAAPYIVLIGKPYNN
ncbi:MAG: class I SAM-dependent methyltransferase [Sphingobacteriales bacterium]|nr:class I SAM-dependent methyltransferase [Sphingobacteriales bacterium]MBI3717438.1 class I SAM-dependent methyltransferase [Sphingobacteriales bacterium]